MLGRHDEALERTAPSCFPRVGSGAALLRRHLRRRRARSARRHDRGARELRACRRRFPQRAVPVGRVEPLARDRGDRAGAQAAMARVFARETRAEQDDPWWTYHLWFVRDADELNPAAQAIARAWGCQSRRSQEMTRTIASVLLTGRRARRAVRHGADVQVQYPGCSSRCARDGSRKARRRSDRGRFRAVRQRHPPDDHARRLRPAPIERRPGLRHEPQRDARSSWQPAARGRHAPRRTHKTRIRPG